MRGLHLTYSTYSLGNTYIVPYTHLHAYTIYMHTHKKETLHLHANGHKKVEEEI